MKEKNKMKWNSNEIGRDKDRLMVEDEKTGNDEYVLGMTVME